MANDFYKRKPVGETIVGKVARDMALRKAGIDPRTDAEKERDKKDRRRLVREFDKALDQGDLTPNAALRGGESVPLESTVMQQEDGK